MTGETEKGRSIKGEKQVLAAEIELGDGPGGSDTNNCIEGHSNGRHKKRELYRSQGIGIGESLKEFRGTVAEAFDNDDDERQEQKAEEENDSKADKGNAGASPFACHVARADYLGEFDVRHHQASGGSKPGTN